MSKPKSKRSAKRRRTLVRSILVGIRRLAAEDPTLLAACLERAIGAVKADATLRAVVTP